MDERLSPKEVARIKREGRLARIRRLRQFVASGAVSLVALFSGVLLTRGLLAQTTSTQPASVARTIATQTVNPESVPAESDDSGATGSTATVVAAPTPTPTPVVTSQS